MLQPLPAYRGTDPYVFVSYSHADEAAVFQQIRWLQDHGVNVFYDEGISPGSEWSDALAQAIEGCAHFVYFVTPNSVASDHCRRELNFALSERRPLLAVYLQETDVPAGIRLSLDNRQAILRHKMTHDAYQRALLTALSAQATRSAAPARTPVPSRFGRPMVWAGVVAIAALAVALGVFTTRDSTPSDQETDDPTDSGKQRVAVLTLRNLTGDPGLSWLADGMSEQLRQQIGMWGHIEVLPSAFVRDWSIGDVPADVVYVVDGFIRGQADDLTVALDLIEVSSGAKLWTETAQGRDTDPYALQHHLATNIARFFGESITDWLAPSRPEAYASYLKLSNIGFYGDLDEQFYLLERTLELDPDWAFGWAQLAFAQSRLVPVTRDPIWLERARQSLARARSLAGDDLTDYFDSAIKLLVEGDVDGAEGRARRSVATGFGLSYAQIMVSSGLYAEAESYLRRAVETDPYQPGYWEWLAAARGNLGDIPGTIAAAEGNARLFPPETLVMASPLRWALPAGGRLDDARALLQRVQVAIERARPGSQYRNTLQWLSLLPLQFELAMAEADPATASAAAQRLADDRMHTLAGVFFLRLNDPRAEEQLELAAAEPQFERFAWFHSAMHLGPALRDHPLIRNLEDAMGFSRLWRLELCKRAATLPPESHITCDPTKYEVSSSRH